MAINTSKTILLEKQYLYVRASKGFYLEGTSTEKIWTNVGYYRFLTANVAAALGNSYVTIHYDSSDADFVAYCSDLFLEELQNSVTVAVENIQSVLEDFAETNHEDIDTLSSGLSASMELLVGDSGTQKKLLAGLMGNTTGSSSNNIYTKVSNLFSNQNFYSLMSALGLATTYLKFLAEGEYLGVGNPAKGTPYNFYVEQGAYVKFTALTSPILIIDSFGNSEVVKATNAMYSYYFPKSGFYRIIGL